MSEPKNTPQYTKAPDTGVRVMPRPLPPQSAGRVPPPPVYSFENPPPRKQLRSEPVVGAEPGFYIVPRSMSPAELIGGGRWLEHSLKVTVVSGAVSLFTGKAYIE